MGTEHSPRGTCLIKNLIPSPVSPLLPIVKVFWVKRIVSWTKWPICYRRHFQSAFFVDQNLPKLFLNGSVDNYSLLIEVVAWYQTGDWPLPEWMMTEFSDAYMCPKSITVLSAGEQWHRSSIRHYGWYTETCQPMRIYLRRYFLLS